MLKDNVRLVEVPSFVDAHGALSVLEQGDLPFKVRRVYYLHNVPVGAIRGEHAHRKLEQIIMCLNGEVAVYVSDGRSTGAYTLAEPNLVLHVQPGIWRSLKFVRPDSVVCVLASREYELHDYIHDYEEFVRWVADRKN